MQARKEIEGAGVTGGREVAKMFRYLCKTTWSRRQFFTAVGTGGLAALPGCWTSALPPAPAPPRSFAGVQLTVACPDQAFGSVVDTAAAVWSVRTGGQIRVVVRPLAELPEADAAVIGAVEAPAFIVQGRLLAVPAEIMAPANLCKWNGILYVYQTKLARWGNAIYGLPLAGEGHVLVYRADLLTDPNRQQQYLAETGAKLEPPRTWEDVAVIGEFATRVTGRPALPPLPADRTRLLTLFHQIAACYDRRPAQIDPSNLAGLGQASRFHIGMEREAARLESPAFLAALDWFESTVASRPKSAGDPVAAMIDGKTWFAVMSLAELAKLPHAGPDGTVDTRYGIAPLPGTRRYFDDAGQSIPAAGGRNSTPYFGATTLLGAVTTRCAKPEAAWDFFAEMAGPAGAAQSMTSVAAGVGPFRTDLSADTTMRIWERYGFDASRTQILADAMDRSYNGLALHTIVNPALALRMPDQAERMAALETAVRAVGNGQAKGRDAMRKATSDWKEVDRRAGDKLSDWLKKSIG